MPQLISFGGLLVMVLLAWTMSSNRTRVPWRVIIMGLLLQVTFAVLILKTTLGHQIFTSMGDLFQFTIDHVEAGTMFVFGINSSDNIVPRGSLLRSIAFGVLPTIVFFSSLMSILYYLGFMQKVVEILARIMQRLLGTSGAESLSAAANIFVGQTEAPLVIRPYIDSMTISEINAVMVGGFATIAGGVMAAYVAMGVDAGHLMTASVISAPAALLIAKVMVPETETPQTLGQVQVEISDPSVNVIEAAAAGATEGMKLAINVAAMLIAFLALLSLLNGVLGWCGTQWYALTSSWLGWDPGQPWSLERLLGFAFAPLAWVMGIPAEDCRKAGELLGIKIVGNEFIAYSELSQWNAENGSAPKPRTVLILTYALAGFANFGSVGIQIGGIGGIAPTRRSDLAKLGVRAMLGGTLAAFMTACVAGILISDDDPLMNPAAPVAGQNLNRIGNNALNEVALPGDLPLESINQTGASSANSAKTCRQAPHGVTALSETITTEPIVLPPAATIAATAFRSAQTVKPYDPHSTLQPTWTRPASSTRAAPTRNFE